MITVATNNATIARTARQGDMMARAHDDKLDKGRSVLSVI
jgi:hypothetical protein